MIDSRVPPEKRIHLDRLKARFGWTGERYRALMAKIIETDTEALYRAVGRVKVGKLNKQAEKIGKRAKILTLPDLKDVLPKSSVFIRKGAEQGKLLNDDLRVKLSKDLRAVMLDFQTKTGLPSYVMRQGGKKGRVNEKLADALEKKIHETFAKYTVKDPDIGIPPNIGTIAMTETYAAINGVKYAYFTRLHERNPEIENQKRWIHNPHRSKTEPRPGHAEMNGKTISMDDLFEITDYRKEDGEWVPTGGITLMSHPHDPHGGPEDVINCHCDLDVIARLPPVEEQGLHEI